MSERVGTRWYGMDLLGTFGVRQDGTRLRQVRTKQFPATPGYSLVFFYLLKTVYFIKEISIINNLLMYICGM